MNSRDKYGIVRSFVLQYTNGSRVEKTAILSHLEFVTRYHRKYLITVLTHSLKGKKKIKRNRRSIYQPVFRQLQTLWATSNYACGQRLKPMIPVYLASLRRHKELIVKPEERKLLLQISSATIDRLLKHDRKRINIKGRSRTKPGSLLKHQIPIKMWTEWDRAKPGFLEIDSVHHCGISLYGTYMFTLDTTDISTGWNECCAHLGNTQENTIQALETIRGRLPFPLLGIDFDCGYEFVNYHLVRYCEQNHITYTRAREAMKNDQAYIEQQNYSVVRRFVGYQRLHTWTQLAKLNTLYELLSDYQNFFQPVMRLKKKVRDGAKMTRTYDVPKTAYQRILGRRDIAAETKQKLRVRYIKLNPKKLLLEITALGKMLSEEKYR